MSHHFAFNIPLLLTVPGDRPSAQTESRTDTGPFTRPTTVRVGQWGIGAGARRYGGGDDDDGAGSVRDALHEKRS